MTTIKAGSPQYWSAVALSCLVSALQGLTLTRPGVSPENGIGIWLLFVGLIGIATDADGATPVRTLVLRRFLHQSACFSRLSSETHSR